MESPEIIELRSEFRHGLALVNSEMDHANKDIAELNRKAIVWRDNMKDLADSVNEGAVSFGVINERLKKIPSQTRWLVGLTICYVSVVVTIASVHGPSALKTIKMMLP